MNDLTKPRRVNAPLSPTRLRLYTPDGEYILVVFEWIDNDTILPVTAYEVPEPYEAVAKAPGLPNANAVKDVLAHASGYDAQRSDQDLTSFCEPPKCLIFGGWHL